MKISILFIISFLFTILTPKSHAAGFLFTLEPIVGYERVQILTPSSHQTNRLFYGGRMTLGVMLFSLEAEYTHASNQESSSSFTQTNTGDRAKAGIRSGFNLGSVLSFYLRGGAQGSQERTERTVSGVTTTTYQAIRINPYLGLGTRFRLSSKFYFAADAVATIPSFSDMSQNEYQVNAGFGLRLP